MADHFDLGRLMGRQEAFGAVASRCTAAQADALREIRDRKLYLNEAKDWKEFCVARLHCSRENADRLIRLLNEFGPTYFEVAQLTRIKAETYRAIAPSIHDQALHCNGEAIAIIPENAARIAAAVDQLAPPAPKKLPPPAPPVPLERRCIELVMAIEAAAKSRERNDEVWKAVRYVRERLAQIALTL